MAPNTDFECGTCRKAFPAGWRARENHCQSTGHQRPALECDTCWRNFDTDNARWQHMNDKNHFQYLCNICDDTWPDEGQRATHQIEEHYYCEDCDRHFQSLNNINMHLKSRVHLVSKIMCPFCKAQFTTATGVTHHLEGGACPQAPNIDRDQMYRFVRQKDPNGMISKKLIGWHGSDSFEATARSWNGSGYQCYICSRTFSTLAGRNQHLKSPAHQQSLYHCPKRACGKEFTALGGLINHLESEVCDCIKFGKVQNGINGLLSGNRLLE